jgi:hypothetical protein
MALPAGANKIQYTVSEPTSNYNFPYKYWEASELNVSVVDLATGTTTILDQLAGDYTVSATNGDPALGATISTAIAYDNHRVTITRIVVVESESDFVRGDGIPPSALNSEFDKSAARQQQFEETTGRSLQHPASDPDGIIYEAPSVEERRNKAVAYDENGNVIAISLTSTGTVAGDSTKGINVVNNLISSRVDDTSIGFNGEGKHEIKDLGVSTSKIEDRAVTFEKLQDMFGDSGNGGFILGNMVGPIQPPYEIRVAGDFLTPSHQQLSTSQAIKDYVDSAVSGAGGGPVFVGQNLTGVTNLPNTQQILDVSEWLPVDSERYMVHLSVVNLGGSVSIVGVTDGAFAQGPSRWAESYPGLAVPFTVVTNTDHEVRWLADTTFSCIVHILTYQKVTS